MRSSILAHAAWLSLLGTAACSESAPASEPVSILITVQDESGAPVRGAELWHGAQRLGASNVEGRMEAKLRLVPGQQARFSRTCPRGYDATPETRAVRMPVGVPTAAPTPTIALRMTCRSSHVDTALVVRTTSPTPISLPVEVDGERVGQTDSLGFAHVHLRAAAESELQVTLNTSAYPELRPKNPVRTFHLSQHDEILLFDQALERAPRAKRRTRRLSRAPAPPRRIR